MNFSCGTPTPLILANIFLTYKTELSIFHFLKSKLFTRSIQEKTKDDQTISVQVGAEVLKVWGPEEIILAFVREPLSAPAQTAELEWAKIDDK